MGARLTTCQTCEGQVSTEALACPHCGQPGPFEAPSPPESVVEELASVDAASDESSSGSSWMSDGEDPADRRHELLLFIGAGLLAFFLLFALWLYWPEWTRDARYAKNCGPQFHPCVQACPIGDRLCALKCWGSVPDTDRCNEFILDEADALISVRASIRATLRGRENFDVAPR